MKWFEGKKRVDMTKECDQIHPLLSRYLEEDLTSRDRLRVARHLNDCAPARSELEDYRLQRRALLALPEPEPPAGLHDRILAGVLGGPAVAGSEGPISSTRPWWSRPGVWGLAAAGLGVALFLSLFSDWTTALRITRKPALESLGESSRTVSENAPEEERLADMALVEETEIKPPAPAPMVRQASAPRAAAPRSLNPNLRNVSLGNTASSASAPKIAAKAKAPPVPANVASKNETDAIKAAAPTAADRVSTTLEKALHAPEMAEEPSAAEETMASVAGAGQTDGMKPQTAQNEATAPGEEQSSRNWSGADGPYGQEHTEVVNDPISLMAYWQLLMPGDPLPPVDFKRESVAVLFLGSRPTAGYSIQVEGVQEGERAVTLVWREQTPPQGALSAQVLTRPWTLQVIPRTSKSVFFLKKN
jgi:anti-sigma factor RsiW